MNIALFDLDNTLIKGDSDYQWGNYLVENNYVDPVSYSEKNENYFLVYLDSDRPVAKKQGLFQFLRVLKIIMPQLGLRMIMETLDELSEIWN